MSIRNLDSSSDDHYQGHIRIPSDLFGDSNIHYAPSLQLPMPGVRRTAGYYPPPRRVRIPEPWTLEAERWPRQGYVKVRVNIFS